MATRTSHNKNNSAIKRIMQEARELTNDPSEDYSAAPLEDDIFEWHCTLRGPQGTDFEGGLYHFRILLPAEYPFRPPSILMLTPNGRFELNTKICISFTNYHEELWQPAWGIRTAIIGLQGFFPLHGQAAVGVGSLEAPPSERRRLAKLSRDWVCPHCKTTNLEHLPDPSKKTEKPEIATQPAESISVPHQSSMVETVSNINLSIMDELSVTPVVPQQGTTTVEVHRRHTETDDQDTKIPIISTWVPMAAAQGSVGSESTRQITSNPRRTSRPPIIILDLAIAILMVLVIALLCRKLY